MEKTIFSEAHKKAIGAAMKGKPQSAEHIAKRVAKTQETWKKKMEAKLARKQGVTK